jgi:protease PrsW
MTIVLFLLAILPGLLICFFIFGMDKYEKEPQLHLAVCFVLGIFATLPAINLEQLGERFFSHNHDLFKIFLFATFVIALSEEILKFLALLFFAYPRKVFNEPLDGIVYSVMVSMGFATLENILYAQTYPDFTTVIARAFTAVPAHAIFAVLMGYFVGKAKFAAAPIEKAKLLFKGFSAAVLAHGTYDFLLLQEQYQLLMMFGTLMIFVGAYYGKKMIEEQQGISPFRDDYHDELNLGELAATDRQRFVQDQEIINTMLNRMYKKIDLPECWASIYADSQSGDEWLIFGIAQNFTDDISHRFVRLPGPSPREVLNLVFSTEYDDEIVAAAEYLCARELYHQEIFKEQLLTHLEEFDRESLSHFHKERLVLLILETKLNRFETPQLHSPLSERAHLILSELS